MSVERADVCLDVHLDDSPSVPVVRVSGQLDLHSAPSLRRVLLDVTGEGGRRVVLDVSGLASTDSVGVSVLVAGHHRARAAGGELVIRHPGPSVRRVLEVCGLLEVLAVEEPATTPATVPPAVTSPVVDPVGMPGPDRPRHLLVWLTGDDDADPPVHLDDELHAGFSLPDWLAGVHDGYPEAVTGVVYDGSAVTGERVADVVRGRRTQRFRGDTTPTSLAGLRRWVSQAAIDVGVPADEQDLAERVVLVASELAANVERHAPGWVLVDLAPFSGGVLVAVTDSRPVVLPPPEDPDGVPGWRGGLDVVRAVSDAFGLLTAPTTKTVWAALGTEVL